MATKGASNRYGNTRNGRRGKASSHIGYAWAKAFNIRTLKDHFNRHGSQMGCSSEKQYEARAVSFANNVDRKNCVSFVDSGGSTYKYNKKSNVLAIITKDGYVVTYFSPKEGYEYYKREKRRKAK